MQRGCEERAVSGDNWLSATRDLADQQLGHAGCAMTKLCLHLHVTAR